MMMMMIIRRGVDPGGWGALTPGKYLGGCLVCFDRLKCHILSFKTVVRG